MPDCVNTLIKEISGKPQSYELIGIIGQPEVTIDFTGLHGQFSHDFDGIHSNYCGDLIIELPSNSPDTLFPCNTRASIPSQCAS